MAGNDLSRYLKVEGKAEIDSGGRQFQRGTILTEKEER